MSAPGSLRRFCRVLRRRAGSFGGGCSMGNITVDTPKTIGGGANIVRNTDTLPCVRGFGVRRRLREHFRLPISVRGSTGYTTLTRITRNTKHSYRGVVFVVVNANINNSMVIGHGI